MMGLGMRFRALVAAVGVLFLAVTVDAVADSKVNSVRLWRAPDNTRLVFDLTGPVQHSVFTLTAPDRLVIDINGATLGAPLNVNTSNTPITAMRSAQRTPTDLRVVIDLKKAVTPKSFSLAPNAQYGNRLVVDLFVSIHADAAPSAAAFGASVFALSDRGATSETARWLADSENRSDLIGGAGNVSLDDKDRMLAGVLLDLSMTASLTSSLNVGQKVLSNIGRVTPLHKQRVEQAGFMVLKSPDIPSILVETGFISNANEASKLAASSHQQALARSISSGVRQFFQQNPPPGTYIAWLRDSGKIVQGPRDHRVNPGETLAMIAVRYQVSPATLRSANSLSSDELKIGQHLTIPGTELAAKE